MCEVWLASRLRSDFKISSNQVLQSLDRELNILGSSFGLVCFPFASYAGVDLGGGNACTLVPTVFRWHGKMEFKCHLHFSFSHDIEKQI